METQVDAGSLPLQSREHPLSHTHTQHRPASPLGLGSAGEELIVLCFLTPANSCNPAVVSTLCPHYLSFHLVRRCRKEGELVSAVPRHLPPRRLHLNPPLSHLRLSLPSHLSYTRELADFPREGREESRLPKNKPATMHPPLFLPCEPCDQHAFEKLKPSCGDVLSPMPRMEVSISHCGHSRLC